MRLQNHCSDENYNGLISVAVQLMAELLLVKYKIIIKILIYMYKWYKIIIERNCYLFNKLVYVLWKEVIKMKVSNINNIEKFFKAIDECKGRVELVFLPGCRFDLETIQFRAVSDLSDEK